MACIDRVAEQALSNVMSCRRVNRAVALGMCAEARRCRQPRCSRHAQVCDTHTSTPARAMWRKTRSKACASEDLEVHMRTGESSAETPVPISRSRRRCPANTQCTRSRYERSHCWKQGRAHWANRTEQKRVGMAGQPLWVDVGMANPQIASWVSGHAPPQLVLGARPPCRQQPANALESRRPEAPTPRATTRRHRPQRGPPAWPRWWDLVFCCSRSADFVNPTPT